MSASLERRYRRLLAWYPAAHRTEYGEEMIGVLLAAASEGQRRPRLSDQVNLIAGGLRARAKAAFARLADSDWSDVLAAYSAAAPALLVVFLIAVSARLEYEFATNGEPGGSFVILRSLVRLAIVGALALAPPLLSLLNRRAGAALALLLAGWLGAIFVTTLVRGYFNGLQPAILAALLIEVVALATSPGPRRGLALLRWRAWLLLCSATAAAGVALSLIRLPVLTYVPLGFMTPTWVRALIVVAAGVVVAVGIELTTPRAVGAGLTAVLAIPASPAIVAMIFLWPTLSTGPVQTSAFLPAIVLACLVTALAWRSRRRRRRT
jgi:hypothetical protein